MNGNLRISGFERSNVLTNEDVRSLLELIPNRFLNGCPDIIFKNIIVFHPQSCKRMFGEFHIGTGGSDLSSISVYNHQLLDRFDKSGYVRERLPFEMKQTIFHEIGHHVHDNFVKTDANLNKRWNGLHRDSQNAFVSKYAKENQEEDFAETFQFQCLNPNLVTFLCNKKAEFMCELFNQPLETGKNEMNTINSLNPDNIEVQEFTLDE